MCFECFGQLLFISDGADVAVPSINRDSGERCLTFVVHGGMGGKVMSKR
jgi:hypothetical protein